MVEAACPRGRVGGEVALEASPAIAATAPPRPLLLAEGQHVHRVEAPALQPDAQDVGQLYAPVLAVGAVRDEDHAGRSHCAVTASTRGASRREALTVRANHNPCDVTHCPPQPPVLPMRLSFQEVVRSGLVCTEVVAHVAAERCDRASWRSRTPRWHTGSATLAGGTCPGSDRLTAWWAYQHLDTHNNVIRDNLARAQQLVIYMHIICLQCGHSLARSLVARPRAITCVRGCKP